VDGTDKDKDVEERTYGKRRCIHNSTVVALPYFCVSLFARVGLFVPAKRPIYEVGSFDDSSCCFAKQSQ